MENQLYVAIHDKRCVVTFDPNDSDIPIGARPAPVSRFTVGDMERLKAGGVKEFTFNASSPPSAQADSAPQGTLGYLQLFLAICVSIIILAIVLGLGNALSGGALLR
jgi:hypothetical protein